ncbi:DUF5671 domain-containing protein [Microbacterium sp. ARD31]|uniref:DUF5671 domain-containing protein n=1 Tax=Microbacterium sp. ARD31 TaxID=2962576 RepID=UPI0028826DE4|nr:DUF5671 domain-containing protein [Microbacterium sp. ARD31]MDT0180332.1 DUF5671 domain-containing protein [Microbacterium sp. ARD31]
MSGIVPSDPAPEPAAQPGATPVPAPVAAPTGRAQSAVRRVLVYVILFALVIVTANGLAGLLEMLFSTGRVLSGGDDLLARSLAFTFIGGPLLGVLWWWQRRRFADPAERSSLMWALYLAAMSTVSLIVATVALAQTATDAIDGRWQPGPPAFGLVWAGVWLWHRWMRRSARTAPTRLATVPVVLGAVYGVAVVTAGAVNALATLLEQALGGVTPGLVGTTSWGVSVAQALVWTAIGALVWWVHWHLDRAKDAPGPFAAVMLVVVIAVIAAITLFAVGTLLFVLLRALFDTDPLGEILRPVDTAIAAALIGGVVWAFHGQVLATRPARTGRIARLMISAVALVGAASGFGVVVNALLATASASLVDDDPRTLLLGGLAALAVGFPVWWIAWRPTRPVPDEHAAGTARRVYLVAVFGASAIVAIVTLLLIGYRLFELLLGSGGGFIERVRAPFGLLSATALVFAYHFAIWRRDRRVVRATAPRVAVGRIVLVATDAPADLAQRLRTDTGAALTVWRAAPAVAGGVDESVLARLHEQLAGVEASRVLALVEPDGAVRMVPLSE